MPSFISWIGHGAASLAQPGVFTGANVHLFTFECDTAAMQRLADTFLNAVGGASVRYEAFVGRGLVTFMTIQRCTSGTDQIGWIPGRECALWVPLLEWKVGDLLPRFVLWAPYVYIDYTIGMLTGRDVWGWPKVLADICVASDQPSDPASFTCKTLMFDPMAPGTRATVGPLFSVTSASVAQNLPSQWKTGREAARALISQLLGELTAEVAQFLIGGITLPAIAMKQLRDSAVANKACYQAIVDSPAQITRFAGGGMLPARDYALTITTCDSHRIVYDFLGIMPTTPTTALPVQWAAWAVFDFMALGGDTIASPP
jgi:hypothetical protein